jgi:threonine synthase
LKKQINSNLFCDRSTFTAHLECSATGEYYSADRLHGLSAAGKPLLVRYDLMGIKGTLSKSSLNNRPSGMWRYREFLPLRNTVNIVSLGEPTTPLISLTNCARELGVGEILVKDESRLPTGSFKARGLSLAVSMAKEFGVSRMAIPTNGNAGAALAAYATRCGIESFVFCPVDTPDVNVREISLQGANVWKVNGLINDCGKIVSEGKDKMNWFDTSTMKEPYRIEGKKTMGLELAEQLGWALPDAIFYPTGGGTGLIGMWKAFTELTEIGWLDGEKPKMVCVQASGCAPIVKAWREGADNAQPWPLAQTIASGIRVPVALGDFLVLRAVRESEGYAISAPDEEIELAQKEVANRDGFLMGPEGAATFAALRRAVFEGRVGANDQVVLFNCGTALKYVMPEVKNFIDRSKSINYEELFLN